MIINYLNTAWRNLVKYKAFSLINIFGLAVAMSVCMLMILMLSDQLSYDRFHRNKDRIYRLATVTPDRSQLRATIPYPVTSELIATSPVVEDAVFLRRGFGGEATYDEKHATIKGYFTTPSFFKVFTFDLAAGDPSSALAQPGSIILSREAAEKLFGSQEAIGKTISYSDRGLSEWTDEGNSPSEWGLFTVTGIFAERPAKSHIAFDAVMSAATLDRLAAEKKIENLTGDWTQDSKTFSYVLLKKNVKQRELRKALDQLTTKYFKDNKNESLRTARLTFQPLTDINPGPAVNNSPSNQLPLFVYYLLGGLVLIILITSCLNYTSLFVARSVTRTGEIGLRKVIGAVRRDLVVQFLCETMLTFFCALLLANVFLLIIKSAFLNLWINQYLDFDLRYNVYVYISFVVFSIIISVISGIYPALKFSRSRPIDMLRNNSSPRLGKWGLRRVLTVSQFAISLIFIITSAVIYNQFKYYLRFDYGFNPGNVVNINLQGQDFQKLKDALKDVPGIRTIGGAAYLPSTGRNDGLSLGIPGKDSSIYAIDLSIDPSFISALDIPILHGSNVPVTTDSTARHILVNESTVKSLGYSYSGDIVGRHYLMNGKDVTVAGVIRDFNFFLLFSGRSTGPLVLYSNPANLKYATVKIEPNAVSTVMKTIAGKWKTIEPVLPLKYAFYSDTLDQNNRGIFDLVMVLGFLAFLAITIACLGLLGMAIYTTERRTKEIGIRKVLGAGVWRINFLLLREFLIMLALAVTIATPLAVLINNAWLNFLVVRDELSAGTVLLGVLVLLVLGLVTIVPQTLHIARRNPVKSLKTDG